MRMYAALCELIEAYAARLRTDTLEAEMENADWAGSMLDGDD